jgi:hypothetical protein
MTRFFALLGLFALWACNAQAQPASAYPPVNCTASAFYSGTATGLQQLVALQSGQRIYVCGYTINVGTASTPSVVCLPTTCAAARWSLRPATRCASTSPAPRRR